MATESLYLVLNEPYAVKPSQELVCLVASVKAPDKPKLVAARSDTHIGVQKGQVVDLSFEGSLVHYTVVDFDPVQTSRVQEFYNRQHSTLTSKNDWSEPDLQRFYSLEQLVGLTSQEQETLRGLLSRQPHVLLFQKFKSLECLSYETYEAVCACFDRTPTPYEAVVAAQNNLACLDYLYAENVRVTPIAVSGELDPCGMELLEQVGLVCNPSGVYSWPYSERVEDALETQLKRLSTGESCVNNYLRRSAAQSSWSTERDVADAFASRMVVLSTGAAPSYRIDLEIEYIIGWAKERGAYIDFSQSHTSLAVQTICENCNYLFLHNVHLVSPVALLGLLQLLPDSFDGLVLYYDCHYLSQTARLLDRYSESFSVSVAWVPRTAAEYTDTAYGVQTAAYWRGDLNQKTLRSGYSFDFPVTWETENGRDRLLSFFESVQSEAVILVSNLQDWNTLYPLLYPAPTYAPNEPLRQNSESFGGRLNYCYHHAEGVVAASHKGAAVRFYDEHDMHRASLQLLGQEKARYKYVFYYNSLGGFDDIALYRLVWHALDNLFLCCNLDILPYEQRHSEVN